MTGIIRRSLRCTSFFIRRSCTRISIPKGPISSNDLSFTPKSLNHSNMCAIMDKYDTVLLDCDGVLWGSDHYTRFEGVGGALKKLRSSGKNVFFVTNNGMHSREKYVDKINEMTSFPVVKEDIYSVSYATALYLHQVLNVRNHCYIIGPLGLKTELESLGIETSGFGFDSDIPSDKLNELLSHAMREHVQAVVVGFDYHFHFNKLYKAASYLSNPNCHYIATNEAESSLILNKNRKLPLTAPIIAAVSNAAQREPLVIGKPHSHLFECIKLMNPHLKPERCLMIGDSLKSDIPFARNLGMDSALVLTGASNEAHVTNNIKSKNISGIPTFILEKFSDFNNL